MGKIGLIPFEKMPDDNDKLAKLDVEFPRLQPDTAASCPAKMKKLLDYLKLEASDGDRKFKETDLTFLRTALVGDVRYWIWKFTDGFDEESYATVTVQPDGTECLGYADNYHKLTPEQFMLGDYHNVF